MQHDLTILRRDLAQQRIQQKMVIHRTEASKSSNSCNGWEGKCWGMNITIYRYIMIYLHSDCLRWGDMGTAATNTCEFGECLYILHVIYIFFFFFQNAHLEILKQKYEVTVDMSTISPRCFFRLVSAPKRHHTTALTKKLIRPAMHDHFLA